MSNNNDIKIKPKTRVVTRLARLMGVLLVFSFAPGIYAAGWHLWHGGWIEFAGERVKVPMMWTGSGGYSEAHLTKSRPTLIFGTWPIGAVTLSKWPELHRSNEASAIQYWQRSQFALSEGLNPAVEIATHSNFKCIQRTSAKIGEERVNVSCYAFPGITVEFFGRKKDVPDVLNMLRPVASGPA